MRREIFGSSTLTTRLLPSFRPTLSALLQPIGAAGAAVIDHRVSGSVLLCDAGEGASTIIDATSIIVFSLLEPIHAICSDGRPVLGAPLRMSEGRTVVVAFWRMVSAKPWEDEDFQLIRMAIAALGALPTHAAAPKDLAWRGPIDDLTGLPRARKLVEDLPRHFARLDRDGLAGTLIIARITGLKQVADAFGRNRADDMLRELARFLERSARPTDVIARIGGDEFAVWLNGMDQFTASERAHRLSLEAPLLGATLEKSEVNIGLSIGIATRQPGSHETINSLMRRADHAMQEAGKAGPGVWRMSQDKVS